MRIANVPMKTSQARSTATLPAPLPAPSAAPSNPANAAGDAAHVRLSFTLNVNLGPAGALNGQCSQRAPGGGVLESPTTTSQCSSGSSGSLQKNPPGWPAGSVKTSGGYTVAPRGGTNWDIFGPDQKVTDAPMTHVWGDPHVHEGDGTTWDFTKSSNFRLPDGTVVGCQTTSETGQSVSKRLDIVNGDQHVSIDGLDSTTPTTSEVTATGEQVRRQLDARADDFVLDTNGAPNEVRWLRERNGTIDGLVTGSTQDAQKTYDQTVQKLDANGRPYGGSSSAAEMLGTEAFEQQLRDCITRVFEGLFGELLGGVSQNAVTPAGSSSGTSSGNQNGSSTESGSSDGGWNQAPRTQGPEVNTEASGSMTSLSELLDAIRRMASLAEELGALEQAARSPVASF